MCIGISMVVVRGRTEPYWVDGENSHTKIRETHSVRDTGDSLPIEFHPTGVLTNPADWKYHIDTNIDLPGWYTENRGEYERECRAVLDTVIRGIAETGEYGGSLYLSNTGITSLGVLQSVGGYLDLRNTGITSLGVLRSVGGYLDLYGTGITSLGVLQSVGGYLDLRNTGITSLGVLQSVGGYLDLRNTGITSLGVLRSVGCYLDLYGTGITRSDGEKICKNVYGGV